jgi:hypothetical protein
MTDDKRIAIGGTIKAIESEGRAAVEGYLVYFTGPEEKDLHDQFFDAETDYVIPPMKLVGSPVLYQHGLDDAMGVRDIGSLSDVKMDDVGIWVQAQLDLHNEYQEAIFKLAQKGVLSWSSGALPQSVEVEDNGHIKRWRIIEGSLTPTPAMPLRTVISAKAFSQMIKDGTGHEDHADADAATQPMQHTSKTSSERKANMDRLEELFAEIAALFRAESPMDVVEEEAVTAALRAEAAALPEDEKKALEADEETDAKAAALDKLMAKAAKVRQDRKAKMQGTLKSRFEHLKRNAPAESVTDRMGVPTQGRVTGMKDLRYAHLSASDMAVGLLVATAKARAILGDRIDPRGFVSEDYLRTMTHKAVEFANAPTHTLDQSIAYKSAVPFKANELDASNIVGQGFEWVSEFWGAEIWERERAPTIYDQLVQMGMRTRVIPQGANSVNIPTSTSDPIVYSSPEANSTDVTMRPEVTVPITPFGTGSVELVARELKVATAATVIPGEDSIVDIASVINQQLNDTLMEHRDKLLINGDTATAASTNINYIDSTPPAGLRRPYFLAGDGFRKLPLVTNTAMSRDGGALTIGDFAATVNLLPYALRSRRNNIAILVDPLTEAAALELSVWLTPDLTGGRQWATLVNGRLEGAFGSVILTSGYIPLTGSAGKEYVITTANNTKGSILAVYLPYWVVGYKRQITIETARDILSGTDLWVASMRVGVAARDNQAAAISYNISAS